MGIFSKIRGGAGQPGYPPKKTQFTQPGQAYVPGAQNVFSSGGYGKNGKPLAPQNRAYEQDKFGRAKTDVWGKAIPAKAPEPQSSAPEDDSWLKELGY
jgi:hypothetical protein